MMRRMIDDMHLAEITIGYGMTETSPLSTQTARDADLETRTETVGTMLPQFEGTVIDADGNLVPLGTPGEYCSRGPGVMLGYWNQPEATAASITRRLDAQRRPRDDGRAGPRPHRRPHQGHDHPRRREHLSCRGRGLPRTHPAVADAAVFGIPCERFGEQVCAWIRPQAPVEADEMLAWCKEQHLHHKVPARIRIVEEFPMTVTGKIQKFAMRDAEKRQ